MLFVYDIYIYVYTNFPFLVFLSTPRTFPTKAFKNNTQIDQHIIKKKKEQSHDS